MIKVTKKHLKNGLTVIMVPDRRRKFTYAEIMIKNGGATRNVLVADKNYLIKPGTFHLLEHNIIENTKKGNMDAYFSKNYVYSNGTTGSFETSFYIDVVKDFYKYFEELIYMVNNPLFNENLVKIKKPIYEEINRKNDIHNYKYYELINKCVYSNDYLNTLGSKEDLENITNEDLKFVHDVFFQPNNQVIMINGNFSKKKVLEIINNLYSNRIIKYKVLDPKEKTKVIKKSANLIENKNRELFTIVFKIPTKKISKIDKIKLNYYLNIFLNYNFDDESKNFHEVVAKNYSYTSFEKSIDRLLKNIVTLKITMQTTYFKEIKEMILKTFKELKLAKEYFELRKKDILVDYICQENDAKYLFNTYLNRYLNFNYNKQLDEEFINNLNYEECLDLLREIDFSNYSVITQNKM